MEFFHSSHEWATRAHAHKPGINQQKIVELSIYRRNAMVFFHFFLGFHQFLNCLSRTLQRRMLYFHDQIVKSRACTVIGRKFTLLYKQCCKRRKEYGNSMKWGKHCESQNRKKKKRNVIFDQWNQAHSTHIAI